MTIDDGIARSEAGESRGGVRPESTDATSGGVTDHGEAVEEGLETLSKEDIRHNMKVVIMLDAIFWAGATDMQIAFGPLLIYAGASNQSIGLIQGAMWLTIFGTVISPWISVRYRIKKWYLFFSHMPYLGALLILGLGLLYSKHFGMDRSSLFIFSWVMIWAHLFFSGFVGLPHQEYTAACIPMSHRGRFMGFSLAIGGTFSFLSGLLGKYVLDTVGPPFSYGYLLVIAWGVCQAGYLLALFGRERPTPVEKAPRIWSREMFAAFWNDKPFVRLVLIGVLNVLLVYPVIGFVAVYGIRGLGLSDGVAAVILIITQAARVFLASPIGILNDKIKPKNLLPYGFPAATVGILPMLILGNDWGIYLSAGLLTVFYLIYSTSFVALTYGLPSPENRSGHYSIQLLLNYGVASLGAFMIGRMFDTIGYTMTFWIVAGLGLVMFPVSKYLLTILSDDLNKYA